MHVKTRIPAYQATIPATCIKCGAHWSPRWSCERSMTDVLTWRCNVCNGPQAFNFKRIEVDRLDWRD